MKDLAVIVPAYNEEIALPTLVAELLAVGFTQRQIIVVNDSSTDSTVQVVRDLGVTLLDLPINLGIGGAMQTGYRWALREGFRFAVQVDGDGQHIPATLPMVYGMAIRDGADLVIGSRFLGNESEFQSSFLRRSGIRWFSFLIKVLTRGRIFDTTSGLRLSSRRLFSVFAEEYPSDYPEPETLAWALAHGYRVAEIGVAMRERQGGSSSITSLRPLYYMLKVTLGILITTFLPKRLGPEA